MTIHYSSISTHFCTIFPLAWFICMPPICHNFFYGKWSTTSWSKFPKTCNFEYYFQLESLNSIVAIFHFYSNFIMFFTKTFNLKFFTTPSNQNFKIWVQICTKEPTWLLYKTTLSPFLVLSFFHTKEFLNEIFCNLFQKIHIVAPCDIYHIKSKLKIRYKFITSHAWTFKWMNFMALTFVTSPPLFATSSTRNKLELVWTTLMKLMHLLHGNW